MRYALILGAAALTLAACTRYGDDVLGPGGGGDAELGAPSDLRYELLPSGNPDLPDGVLLRWTDPGDGRVAGFVVYSRASTSDGWSRRAETTSNTFHDAGVPHLQYYVTAQDQDGHESRPSNTVTIDERTRLPAPTGLTSIALDKAMQLSWAGNARAADPALFNYYRVYSTAYDLDHGRCDDAAWVLEGTTVSEDFLATGLTNGVPRCFAVSTVSVDGHESVWSGPRSDTPRYDARNVVVFAPEVQASSSGFRFYLPATGSFGNVLAGSRTDLDFRIERRPDSSLWLVPVRAGVRVALYGTSPVDDVTSIDVAPVSGYSTGAIEALPGYLYVFETLEADGLHYGAVRVTHVSADYLILDWAYQSDRGNPDLQRLPRTGPTLGT